MSSARSSNDNHASIELVLREMVAQIVAHEDFEQFIAWTRANAQRTREQRGAVVRADSRYAPRQGHPDG